jgi:hypothetical protein
MSKFHEASALDPVEALAAETTMIPPEDNSPLVNTRSEVNGLSYTSKNDSDKTLATPSSTAKPPTLPPLSTSRRIALVALATTAIILSTASSTSLNIALPTIQRDLNMTITNLQWISSAFTLANGCLLLLSGRIADVHGRKKVFVVGMTWQAVWSLIGGFMKTGSGLIVCRALAGVGAAMR